MPKHSAYRHYFAGRFNAFRDMNNHAALWDRMKQLMEELSYLFNSQMWYRATCKPIEPEMIPAMRSEKVTVSKPYAEMNRHGKERFRVVVKAPTGKRCFVFGTLAEANRERQRLEKQHRQDFEKTVAELIEEYQAHCLTERSYRPRTAHVENHRLHDLFSTRMEQRLSTLTRAKAEAMVHALCSRSNRKSGAPRLSVATRRHDSLLLRRFGAWACKAKYVRENPFVGLMPAGKVNVGKVHLTTDERVKWVQECEAAIAAGSDLALAALFCLYRGTRAAEILNRQVSDVDDGGTKLIISNAKTKAGNRRLSIPEALRGHFAALCAGKSPTDPLFAQTRPGPKKFRRTASLHRVVQRICKRAGVKQICTHSLRGMNAELQLEGGTSEDVVAKSLGHTSIRMTKTHYINRDVQDSISARKVDSVLSKYDDPQLPLSPNEDAQLLLSRISPEVAAALRKMLQAAQPAA